MKYNTRFNPTPTGSLHCGHLYMALVNANEAHCSKGNFVVRIDDTQPQWKYRTSKETVDKLCIEYHEQLSDFMIIDKWERQSEMPSPQEIMGYNPIFDFIPKPKWEYESVADWILDPDMPMYPYAPYLTIEKVVWDYCEGVNWLIRGEEIVTEASLYNFFIETLRLPFIRQSYLPKLRAGNRDNLGSLLISKTFRNYKLQDQLDKFGIDKVLDYLKQSCLIDPDKDFYTENVKWNPTVVGFEP